jgi:hypothetical protein
MPSGATGSPVAMLAPPQILLQKSKIWGDENRRESRRDEMPLFQGIVTRLGKALFARAVPRVDPHMFFAGHLYGLEKVGPT